MRVETYFLVTVLTCKNALPGSQKRQNRIRLLEKIKKQKQKNLQEVNIQQNKTAKESQLNITLKNQKIKTRKKKKALHLLGVMKKRD